MPLHEKIKVVEKRLDDVYGSLDLSVVMPKHKDAAKDVLGNKQGVLRMAVTPGGRVSMQPTR
jgi:hypothetical protein